MTNLTTDNFTFHKAALVCVTLGLCACTTPGKKTLGNSTVSKPTSAQNEKAKGEDGEEVLPDADIGDCKNPASNISKPTPFYVPSLDIFMTDFTNHCRDSYLVEKDSDWAAMRVPCTEGSGKVEEKGGNSANPDLVGFPIDVNCDFLPADQPAFEAKVNTALGLEKTASSLAINPLAVQYWEVENSNDSDVGNVVMLRTNGGLSRYKEWEKGAKGKSIKVDLYGRENAWGSEQHFYHYEAEIVWTSHNRFRIKVTNARELSEQQKEEVGARCRSLKPKRACHLAF